MEGNFKMLAKTFYGMEDLLVEELKNLGAQQIEKGNRVVHFVGDKGFMYKANMSLRTWFYKAFVKIIDYIRRSPRTT